MTTAGAGSMVRIDLISDTATRPSLAMRRALSEAPVGDEQLGEDPSVNALTERVARLLGKEAALFLPSGTMCNQIALAVHCGPGDEVIASETAHVIGSEGAGAAVFAGAVIRGLPTTKGIFTGEQLSGAVRTQRVKSPRARAVVIEQTDNAGGGSVWPLRAIEEVAAIARANDLALHMDGARLMNAVVASGTEAADFAAPFDSVWLDFSKGLGCPIGAVLAGSRGFIEEADVWKHRFGGAMRQAGIVAAAGLYALDHNIERLAADHDNAHRFAAEVSALPGVSLCNPAVETNLVFIDIGATGLDAATVAGRLLEHGIRVGIKGPGVIRAVFHLDVDAAQTDEAILAFRASVAPQVTLPTT
jgi:threonine aldolase